MGKIILLAAGVRSIFFQKALICFKMFFFLRWLKFFRNASNDGQVK